MSLACGPRGGARREHDLTAQIGLPDARVEDHERHRPALPVLGDEEAVRAVGVDVESVSASKELDLLVGYSFDAVHVRAQVVEAAEEPWRCRTRSGGHAMPAPGAEHGIEALHPRASRGPLRVLVLLVRWAGVHGGTVGPQDGLTEWTWVPSRRRHSGHQGRRVAELVVLGEWLTACFACGFRAGVYRRREKPPT